MAIPNLLGKYGIQTPAQSKGGLPDLVTPLADYKPPTQNPVTKVDPNKIAGIPSITKHESPVAQIINQWNAGQAQIDQPFIDKGTSGGKGVGQVKALEGALSVGAGIVNKITAPAAHIFNVIGALINKAGDALAETPPIKAYGRDTTLDKNFNPQEDTATRILTAIQNAAVVGGAVVGGVEALKGKSPEIPTQLPVVSQSVETPIPVKPVETPVAPKIAPTAELPTKAVETPVKLSTHTTQTLKPIEGTGETKTRGAALSLEAGAIEKGLTENLGDLPEYKTVNFKEMTPKIMDTFAKDPEGARAIALGEKPAPKGTTPEMFAVTLEKEAHKTGDIKTIQELANSKLTTAGTTMGQRIASYAQRDTNSAVHAIQEVQKARIEALAKKGQTISSEVAKARESIRKTHTKETWGSFIDSISC